MKIITATALAALLAAGAVSGANAQTVLNTALPNANNSNNVNPGFNPATTTTTTTTNANGTTTTTTGPSGDGNRYYQTPAATTWQQQAVGGGGTVGITNTYTNDGNGAAYFSTVNGDSKGDLNYNFTAPVLLSDLTSISYDFYRDGSSTTGANFQPVMRLNITENNVFAGSLVLEYIYQNQTTPPVNAWTNLSGTLTSGIFWATNTRLGPTFAAADGGQKTLQAWLDGNAGDTLRVTGVSLGVGSGWSGTFSGAADHAQYAFTGGPSNNFDFAVAGGAVPEPATWAMMIIGFGATGSMIRRRKAVIA